MNNTTRIRKAVSMGLLLAACLLANTPARATLGEYEQTVQSDQTQMKATMRGSSAVQGRYTMHRMQTPAGTVVKEYAEPGGRIFAVAWKGPIIPDLRQLLGRHFDTYVNNKSAVRQGHTHAALNQSGLVVRSQGRMRAFSGIAYIPGLVPAGISVEDLP